MLAHGWGGAGVGHQLASLQEVKAKEENIQGHARNIRHA